jgi:hypothetical protein
LRTAAPALAPLPATLRPAGLLLLWLGGCAGAVAAPAAPPAATPDPAAAVAPAVERASAPVRAAPLERARAALRPAAVAADVAFLADDALVGRATPSPGQRIAARYLIARLERLGFEPGTAGDGWLHPFELESKRVDPARTHLTWSRPEAPLRLAPGPGLGVHPFDARSGSWTGAVVFAGEGDDDELEAAAPAGRWVLCVEQRYGRRRSLQREAAERGALGLVLVGRAEGREAPFESWSELSGRIRPGRASERPEDALPCVWLTPEAAALPAGLEPGTLLAGELSVEIGGGGPLELHNVAGLWPGEGPLAHEVIVVSAHYDHMGRDRAGEIMNGADDNASGTAGLLALAEALDARGPLARSVLLLWVSAEELGLYGSRAWCEDPRLPAGLVPVANVNLDMVGRNDPLYVELTPSPEHGRFNPLAAAAIELVAEEGFGPPAFVDRDFERSDQASFAERLSLPVLYLSCGEHDDYHEPTDDAERIDAGKITRVVGVVLRLLERLQAEPLAFPAPAPGTEG